MYSWKIANLRNGHGERRKDPTRREYFRSLEGIRGYAFLAVFFTHYNLVLERPASLWKSPAYLALNLGWFLVPIFFVLSGFLITRILLNTRDRDGFFRVFYLRRAIRVLPLYYVLVAIVTVAALVMHYQMGVRHLAYLFYLQNFTDIRLGQWIDLSHLWSLAIEEQFYLLWPLAIWKFRDEKKLMQFTYALIAACFVFRAAWPLWHLSAWHAYTFTPSRADGILLGCALALHYKYAKNWDRFVLFARVSLPILFASMVAVLVIKGSTLPQYSYLANVFCTPVMNLIGYALVILALTPDTLVDRVCSGKTICSFGQLTYGLYLIHQMYSPVFFFKVTPWLGHHMSIAMAQFVASIMALALTTALAWLANRYIELPMAKMKDRFKYGPAQLRPIVEVAPATAGFAFPGVEKEAVVQAGS